MPYKYTKQEMDEWLENIKRDELHKIKIDALIEKDKNKRRHTYNYYKECVIQDKILNNEHKINFID